MINTILFDFDGTLVNSIVLGDMAIQDLKKYNNISADQITPQEMWGYTHEEFCKKLVELNNTTLTWQEISKLDHKYMQKHYSNAKIIDKDFLLELNKKNIKIGIISSNLKNIIELVINNKQNKGIKFDPIYTFDDSNADNRKSDLINRAIIKLKTTKENCAYVGDHIKDIEAAKLSNVLSIAIPTGIYTKEQLSKAQPDIIINSLPEIKKYL
jgi:phosphoglycolate phosphatase-like HAD superfamily hydrolase